MRIILSRKGFDSANGGVPSPIFPSGEMRSLPIPQPDPSGLRAFIRYNQIAYNGRSLGDIISDLAGRRVTPDAPAHLDPDLDASSLPRHAGWRPMFGQNKAAESHLRNQRVQADDVFLFFGWFRRVEQVHGRYRYAPGAPDLHVLFGWLQIERHIALPSGPDIPAWARYHPHCQVIDPDPVESLYLATSHLTLPGITTCLPGGGVFDRFTPARRLTAEGCTRRIWRLPGWFYPSAGRRPLSYHSALDYQFERAEQTVLLHSAAPGQEFVLDCDEYPEAIPWLARLLDSSDT